MTKKTALVFLHGLESGPHGSKYQALHELDPDIIAPDCTGLGDLAERLAVIETTLVGLENMVIVGSSFGGLAALLFAQREENRDRVVACLLCAPALSLPEARDIHWLPKRTTILHGTEDDIVPFQASADFCASRDVTLIAVKDDHRLSESRDRMVSLAAEMMRVGGA